MRDGRGCCPKHLRARVRTNTQATPRIKEYEYDAYTSFTYNFGRSLFCHSSLLKKLNRAPS
ncbi:glycoside hydrolase family protein [Pseudoduganella rivuli]|uniref:glycoside hydrolase family protein n=1 Tax=Pseudoduganella rivuli TaxID=2666085 RepID=UPI0035315F14